MIFRSLSISACAALIAAPVFAQSMSQQDFVNKATVANTLEIQSSQLALQAGQSADVKAFAQQMITDHTKAGHDMQAALGQDTSAPSPMMLDDAHQAMLNGLQGKTGKAFDDAYVDLQQNAHTEAISLFQAYAQNGQPGPVRDFAAATLPTLQMHKQHVQQIDAGN